MSNWKMQSAAVIVGAVMLASAAEGQTTWYVDADNCPGPGSGFPWDPYCSIQAAIDNAVDTDEIEVAPGTYFETINFLGKAVTLRSDIGPDVTVIDAGGHYPAGSVVTCAGGEGPDTILQGFTVTGAFTYDYGGGMYNDGSSPTVTDCTFTRNIGLFGGGMYNSSGNPTVTDCTFSENRAGHGGGIYNYESSPTVVNCTFIGNRADRGGGMLNVDNGDPTLIGCTFSGNFAANLGGGMWNAHADPTVTNCTFSGNTADYAGGGIMNNISNPKVTNCIFRGNTPYEIFDYSSSTVVTYSDVQGGWPGPGNIDADPLFVQAPPPPWVDCCFWRDGSAGCADPRCEAMVCEEEPFCCDAYWDWDCVELAGLLCGDLCAWRADLRPSPGSPCIDAGDNTAVPDGITTDLDDRPRFVDDPATADTGYGDPPVVDMGAYEFQTGCPWDCGMPADGQVSVVDFLALLAQWGTPGTCDCETPPDGVVDVGDFLAMLAHWGPCP